MANVAGNDAVVSVAVATVTNDTVVAAGVAIVVYTGQFVVSAFTPPLEGQLWPRQVIRQ